MQVRLELRFQRQLDLVVTVIAHVLNDNQYAKPGTWQPLGGPGQADLEGHLLTRRLRVRLFTHSPPPPSPASPSPPHPSISCCPLAVANPLQVLPALPLVRSTLPESLLCPCYLTPPLGSPCPRLCATPCPALNQLHHPAIPALPGPGSGLPVGSLPYLIQCAFCSMHSAAAFCSMHFCSMHFCSMQFCTMHFAPCIFAGCRHRP